MKETSIEEFEELLRPGRRINLQLLKYFEEKPRKFIAILTVYLKDYTRTTVELMKVLEKQKGKCLYVTVNKTAEDLIKLFSKNKVSSKNIEFIDLITNIAGRSKLKGKNIKYLDSPTDLVGIASVISKKIEKSKEAEFIVLDSISTLILYNKREAVEKFSHSLAGKMRGKNITGVLVMVQSAETKGITERLSQFADEVIEIK